MWGTLCSAFMGPRQLREMKQECQGKRWQLIS
jgi:hypothetical protein